LPFCEEVSDITDTIKTQPIADTPLCDRCLETVRVSNDPVRHETTITATCHTQAVLVDIAIVFKCVINSTHQISIILSTVIGAASIDKRLSISMTAAWIRI